MITPLLLQILEFGGETMEQLTLKLEQLVQPKRNIRIHTEKQLKEFERSVRMFGQIRPIVIDENYEILAGNGLYETLIRMNIKEALVYRYTDLTENQKKKLMIADNRIFSLGIENMDTLNSFLEEMKDDLDIPGFDSEILQQMVADAADITEKISEYGTLDEVEIQQIKAANEKREAEQPVSPTTTQEMQGKPQIIDTSVENPAITPSEEGQSAEVQKCVICPKCGEKIWL